MITSAWQNNNSKKVLMEIKKDKKKYRCFNSIYQ
ncbi:hypothetical protein CDIF29631_03904 (plasmid) [Clostridioides difficile]|nr:Uncharacterised protein [Clostridioides difficile]